MRKVDGLSLFFIEFFVPALTPRLTSIETSLQVSENITLFTVWHIYRCHQLSNVGNNRFLGRIVHICMLYNVGDWTDPCGTPSSIFLGVDTLPSTEALNFLSEGKELMSSIKLIDNFSLDNLYSKPRCHVVSKAFSISKNTAAVDMLLLKYKFTWSVSLIH
jgi:hypothetical protein